MKKIRIKGAYPPKAACICIFLLTALFFAGCAARPYGSLDHTESVTQMFRTGDVPGNYSYYIIGRSQLPYAIAGLAPEYRMESELWERVEPNTAEFAEKVASLWEPDVWYQYEGGRGAWIRGPRGKKIGLWYSRYPHTTVVVKPDNRVVLFSPYRPTDNPSGNKW